MYIKNFPSGPLQANSYLIWDDTKEGFMVDLGGFNEKIVTWIEREGIKLKYIILTHGHCDHIGGVNWMKSLTGAKVVAAADELEMLEDSRINMSSAFGDDITITPDVLVGEEDNLKVGKMTLEFILTPGHSKGGMCIKVGKALFSGDTLFNSSVGRTDFYGGSMETLTKSIREKLFVLDDDVNVYPGHMGTTTIGYEKEHNPFV